MSEKEIIRILANARFKFRSDSLSNWETINPTLLSGEFGVVTDDTETEKVKIGDGVTPWNELGWWKGPKGDTGAVGPQGEKGDPGKDAATDQTYDPESKNAQSGVAVAPVLQKKFELWQSNTEYKVGDTVLAPLYDKVHNFYYYAGMVCIKNHISPASNFPNMAEDFEEFWISQELIVNQAYSAVTDSAYNDIYETYATKKELNNAIGDISTAFDELHTYAQALVSGGASE